MYLLHKCFQGKLTCKEVTKSRVTGSRRVRARPAVYASVPRTSELRWGCPGRKQEEGMDARHGQDRTLEKVVGPQSTARGEIQAAGDERGLRGLGGHRQRQPPLCWLSLLN